MTPAWGPLSTILESAYEIQNNMLQKLLEIVVSNKFPGEMQMTWPHRPQW